MKQKYLIAFVVLIIVLLLLYKKRENNPKQVQYIQGSPWNIEAQQKAKQCADATGYNMGWSSMLGQSNPNSESVTQAYNNCLGVKPFIFPTDVVIYT